MFSSLGLAIIAVILLWVYAGFSPRNAPIIEYKGNISFGEKIEGIISQKKEIHNYRFQGIAGQVVDLEILMDVDIRYGTNIVINNPQQLFEVLDDPLETNTDGIEAFLSKRIRLKSTGTFTLSVDYDFKRHSNYYDFDYFFTFWDRKSQEWINKYPKYEIQINNNKSISLNNTASLNLELN